jgi:hypothetical protein
MARSVDCASSPTVAGGAAGDSLLGVSVDQEPSDSMTPHPSKWVPRPTEPASWLWDHSPVKPHPDGGARS